MTPACPVLTLPFDIISEIFIHCLPVENALPSSAEAPLLVAAVCREWRDVALATPRLWKDIDIETHRTATISTTARLLEVWVPRAGNLPRNMSLMYGSNEAVPVFSVEMQDVIERHVFHWTTLDLRSLSFVTFVQLKVPTEGFVSLRKLGLPGQFWHHPEELKGPIHAFSTCPHLRELHIDFTVYGNIVFDVLLPWGQITTLRLDEPPPIQLLTILALVPNLVNFIFSPQWVPPIHSPQVTSQLQFLKLSRNGRNWHILDYLTLPALQDLELDLSGSRFELAPLESLFTRSACLLRRLSIELCGASLPRHELVGIFLLLGSLEELDIKNLIPPLDPGLAVLKENPHLLPNLTSLSVERRTYSHGDSGLWADLLEARWNVPIGGSLPVQLKSFTLDLPHSPPPKFKAKKRLRLLRMKGMDIQITSSGTSWF
ncbi:hypothetical protein B0H16DRAFT_1551586 [Mycena metata]|uniref:F-box domain-containing protein n=1 Tax=Mycena metata TaxID=1033252 RepID=A0AAD7ISN8_9AGAR|nr:hypothetical protein B0H16DRAFT_1551586 [Mycena metata]